MVQSISEETWTFKVLVIHKKAIYIEIPYEQINSIKVMHKQAYNKTSNKKFLNSYEKYYVNIMIKYHT